MPLVGAIQIHPIKALAPVSVRSARVLPSGALELDRRWAFLDANERFANGKNRADIHRVSVSYDLERLEVLLDGEVYSLERQAPELSAHVSEILGEPVCLREDRELGFPDDLAATGPTFVSAASLECVGGWFGLNLEQSRARFRTNLELAEAEAFWEDGLYGLVFSVGDVQVEATNPCARCVVPTRDPLTGAALQGFQRRFTALRQQTLDGRTEKKNFNHFYRFAVNTRIAPTQAWKRIHVGDRVAS